MSNIKTLEQGRASKAFECAKKGAELGKPEEYKSYVKKIPMLIKTNGLGATMAFIFAKSKGKTDNAYGLIYKQTEDWIVKERKLLTLDGNKKFVEKICELNSSEYRHITNEVISFFTWLRRFAEGLITKD